MMHKYSVTAEWWLPRKSGCKKINTANDGKYVKHLYLK